MKPTTASQRQLGAFALALVLLSLLAFGPVRHNGFINLDDNIYITSNTAIHDGLNSDTVRFAFTSTVSDTWHPLTWLSHALDIQLFGLDPAGHHLMSLTLHILASLLLMFVLARMTGRIVPAAAVALLFALHPLRVESVAWAAERKDVLSAVFFMLTLWAHHRYAVRQTVGRYVLVFLAFVLGVLAKPMLVTLPFVLMLVDYWPLERFNRRSMLEKIPMLIAAAVLSWVAYSVQAAGGATTLVKDLPTTARIGHAFSAYFGYLGKIFFPVDLVVLAPHPGAEIVFWKPILALAIMAGLTALFLFRFRSQRYLLTGWLWYAGMLVPVAGFVAVGYHGLADRFTYLPSIGIAIIVVFGLADLVDGKKKLTVTASILAIAIILCLTVMTRTQVQQWRSVITLYKHTLEHSDRNPVIHFNLGCAYRDRGNTAKASYQFKQIVAGDPVYVIALVELGNLRMNEARYVEAVNFWRQALAQDPDNYNARLNLGRGLAMLGQVDEAVDEYLILEAAHPNNPDVLTNLALFMFESSARRDIGAARRYAEKACQRTRFSDPRMLFTWARTLAADQDQAQALEVARRAEKLATKAGNRELSQIIKVWLSQQ